MNKYVRNKLELAYRAHIFDVYNDYLTLPDGRGVVYDLIKHRPGACILPITEDGKVVLVRQYRNSIDEISYEVPAGLLDDGESPEIAAVRELEEETGYTCSCPVFITKTVLAIGTSDEQTSIYVGKAMKKGNSKPDEDEFLETVELEMKEVESMITRGDISDSKTLIAIFAYICMKHTNSASHNLKQDI